MSTRGVSIATHSFLETVHPRWLPGTRFRSAFSPGISPFRSFRPGSLNDYRAEKKGGDKSCRERVIRRVRQFKNSCTLVDVEWLVDTNYIVDDQLRNPENR